MAGMMRIRNGGSMENAFKFKSIKNTDLIAPSSGITLADSSRIALSTFMVCNICFRRSSGVPAFNTVQLATINSGYRPTVPGFIGTPEVLCTVEATGVMYIKPLIELKANTNIWLRGMYMFNCG